MRIMILSTVLLVIGVAILVVKPFLGQPAATGAEVPGTWPHWTAVLGYFICLIGAAGLFLGWVRRKRVT